jgi:hypothetical protein
MKRRILFISSLTLVVGIWFVSCLGKDDASSSAQSNRISYNFHIRPILSDKCFKCHGPDPSHREAGLRLDLADSAYAPLRETKGAFALVPGKPDESELYRRISSTDPDYVMPTPDSHLGALTEEEVAIFRQWIKEGAQYESHWAFIPPQKNKPPQVKQKDWVKNDIDYFILAELERRGLKPNEEADKERLLKRVAYDITGLPPSIEMMDRFLADKSENAYEKIVDELLQMPQYGERMAVHWMDIARYADSYGYQDDNIRTQWPWRDWVIHAFNKNISYDQFITWQIAGDMLPDANKEQVLATAFLRNHKYTEEGGVVPEEYRIEYLLDKTKTYTKAILGITMECAQCHDHKYDPFSQKDYFSMFAFFNNTREVGYEGDVSVSKPAKHPILEISAKERKDLLQFINAKDSNALTVSVMGELDTLRKTYVLNRGVYDQPGEMVQPAAVRAVMPFDTAQYSRNRLGLAGWTFDERNPLTARVFVNQVWQLLFGKGIVKTSGDFGMQGELPSHPDLLDWLAVDFRENGWDIKRLIRQIVLSASYRQSAEMNSRKLEKDPENIYLSRGPRKRLEAEFVRDMYLSSSGLLNPTIGGPSVKPYQPKGLWEATTSGRGVLAVYRQDHGEDLYRRGLYTFIKLTVPPPGMILFDASHRDQCEVRRLQTNTPLQALIMMNEPGILEASRVLAERLQKEEKDARAQIATAFRRIVCRSAAEKEMATLLTYYDDQLALYRDRKLNAAKTLNIGEYPRDKQAEPAATAALMKTIGILYNLEETIMR